MGSGTMDAGEEDGGNASADAEQDGMKSEREDDDERNASDMDADGRAGRNEAAVDEDGQEERDAGTGMTAEDEATDDASADVPVDEQELNEADETADVGGDDSDAGSDGGTVWWPWRRVAAGVVGVFLILGAVFAMVMVPLGDDAAGGNETVEADDVEYASGDEARGEVVADMSASMEVVIGDRGANPARVSGAVGDVVRFINDRSHPIRLVFEGETGAVVIEAGGSELMRFRGIAYYTVVDADSGGRVTRGSVSVQ